MALMTAADLPGLPDRDLAFSQSIDLPDILDIQMTRIEKPQVFAKNCTDIAAESHGVPTQRDL